MSCRSPLPDVDTHVPAGVRIVQKRALRGATGDLVLIVFVLVQEAGDLSA
jgi:hypothetical protein